LHGAERAKGSPAQLGQALAEALHLLLDALDVGFELAGNLRANRASLIAQRCQPIPHLMQFRSVALLVRCCRGGGVRSRTVHFLGGLCRHVFPLAR
jgi:hypothetical protein